MRAGKYKTPTLQPSQEGLFRDFSARCVLPWLGKVDDTAATSLPRFQVSAENTIFIDNYQEFVTLLAKLKLEKKISLDVETGKILPEEPLNAHLSLILFALDSDDSKSYIVDWLKIRRELFKDDPKAQTVLSPLKEVLEDPNIEKVIHFASFEKDQFRKLGINIQNITDTHKLAKKYYPFLPSLSLGACATEILRISVNKDNQTSDWMVRPLSEEQIQYAANDPRLNLLLLDAINKIKDRFDIPKDWSVQKLFAKRQEALDTSSRLLHEESWQYDRFDFAFRNIKEYCESRLKKLFNDPKTKDNLVLTCSDIDPKPISYKEKVQCSTSMNRRKKTLVDLSLLKQLHPDLYDTLVVHSVSINKLFSYLLSHPDFNSPVQIESFVNQIVTPKKTLPKFKQKQISDDLKTSEELALYFQGNEKHSAELIYQAKQMARQFLHHSEHHTIKDWCKYVLFFTPTPHSDNYHLLLEQFKKLKSIFDQSFAQSGDTVDTELSVVLLIKEKLKFIHSNPLYIEALHLRIYAKILEDRIQQMLIDQSSGEQNKITVSTDDYFYQIEWKTQNQVDIDKLKEEYPQIYDDLVRSSVTQVEIYRFLSDEGFSNSEAWIFMDSFIKDDGYEGDYYLEFRPSLIDRLYQ